MKYFGVASDGANRYCIHASGSSKPIGQQTLKLLGVPDTKVRFLPLEEAMITVEYLNERMIKAIHGVKNNLK